jgi:iron complex transport system substrate-binding protein
MNAAEPGCPSAGTLLAEAATGAVTIVDDQGTEIRLPAPARRIIALYGAFNEILEAMGLADRLAARTQADVEPPQIAALPSIGTHMRPNLELILGLAPDLVLQMGGREAAGEPVAALRRLGVPAAFFTAGSFAELFAVIERLGALTGEPARAAALSAALTARLDKVEEKVKAARAKGATAPRVVYEARYPNLLAAGRLSLVSEVIERAGGVNAVEIEGKLVRLAEEELLRLGPDVYLVQQGPMNPTPIPLADRPHFASLAAVKAGRVHTVDERAFSRPGPRAVEAVEELARILYPEAGW